ncbi:hypothetical protein BZA77DRAFT_324396 [Pyronema omphalodes]|nr:hypothetical protein BZA77DRAFT_324396 [Pyronema omphalodes]
MRDVVMSLSAAVSAASIFAPVTVLISSAVFISESAPVFASASATVSPSPYLSISVSLYHEYLHRIFMHIGFYFFGEAF